MSRLVLKTDFRRIVLTHHKHMATYHKHITTHHKHMATHHKHMALTWRSPTNRRRRRQRREILVAIVDTMRVALTFCQLTVW